MCAAMCSIEVQCCAVCCIASSAGSGVVTCMLQCVAFALQCVALSCSLQCVALPPVLAVRSLHVCCNVFHVCCTV